MTQAFIEAAASWWADTLFDRKPVFDNGDRSGSEQSILAPVFAQMISNKHPVDQTQKQIFKEKLIQIIEKRFQGKDENYLFSWDQTIGQIRIWMKPCKRQRAQMHCQHIPLKTDMAICQRYVTVGYRTFIWKADGVKHYDHIFHQRKKDVAHNQGLFDYSFEAREKFEGPKYYQELKIDVNPIGDWDSQFRPEVSYYFGYGETVEQAFENLKIAIEQGESDADQ